MLPPERMMEVYKATVETWRSQVDSSWQRSTYFATFEIAAVGGCWFLVSNTQRLQIAAGAAFSFGGLALTVIWYLSTKKTWEYVRHWWDSICTIEKSIPLAPYDFAQQLQSKEKEMQWVRYRTLVFSIPRLFCLAWSAIFLVAVVRLVCTCAKTP
jgi:hypothetical protein